MGADRADRAVVAVAAATVAVYVLVMAGATATIVDAVAACDTWPSCGGIDAALDDSALAVAWGHRLLALVAGVLVAWATVSAWSVGGRRVRVLGVASAVLYPVQVAIGAIVALAGASDLLSGLHLAVGMAIFAGLVGVLGLLVRSTHAGAVDAASGTVATTTGEPRGASRSGRGGLGGTLAAYVELTKPRLMWLLCLVAAAGMALAAGPSLGLRTAVATLAGGVLAIGASGTFNHVFERDLDRRMARTADRPLATDRVGVRNATAFGVVLGVGAVAAFATVNLLAAVLGLAAIAYYSVVYTLLLKPNTVQNTVVGGLAGAFPALIGAAAATQTLGAPALLLGLVVFCWTPAHFYSLALVYREDYERGGVPMFPVVRGEAATLTHILGYLGATFLAVAALAAVADLGVLSAATAVGFGAVFVWAVVALHRRPTERAAWRSFHASNAFLGAVLLAVVVDSMVV